MTCRVDFGDWEKVVRFVLCAMRTLLADTRGRTLSVSIKKICIYVMRERHGNCFAVVYNTLIMAAVKELFGPCLVAELPKKALYDVPCLKRILETYPSDGHR